MIVPRGDSKAEGGNSDKYFTENCDCMFIVDDFEDFTASDKPHVLLKLRSLSSTVESQSGRECKEKFFFSEKAVGRLLEAACAMGLYNKAQWKADEEAGLDPEVPIETCVGLVFCAPVVMRPDKDDPNKFWPNIGGAKGFTFWGCGDEGAFHIPLDPEYTNAMNAQGGLIRKDGTQFKRTAAPVQRTAPAANGTANGNGAAHPATRAAAPAARPAAAPPAASRPAAAAAVQGAARSLI